MISCYPLQLVPAQRDFSVIKSLPLLNRKTACVQGVSFVPVEQLHQCPVNADFSQIKKVRSLKLRHLCQTFLNFRLIFVINQNSYLCRINKALGLHHLSSWSILCGAQCHPTNRKLQRRLLLSRGSISGSNQGFHVPGRNKVQLTMPSSRNKMKMRAFLRAVR